MVFYIFHHGWMYKARTLRRLTSNYRASEIQISCIFWFKLHCYNSIKGTGTSHYVKISCRDYCAAYSRNVCNRDSYSHCSIILKSAISSAVWMHKDQVAHGYCLLKFVQFYQPSISKCFERKESFCHTNICKL
jgi:hypothetical protein